MSRAVAHRLIIYKIMADERREIEIMDMTKRILTSLLVTAALFLCPSLFLGEGHCDHLLSGEAAYGKDATDAVKTDLTHKISKYHGEKTTLVIDSEFYIPRHDSNDNGHTTISVLANDGTLLFKQRIADNFHCLGYNRARHAFILQTLGEVVSFPAITAIEYVAEDKPAVVNFHSFTDGYFAFAEETIPSPDLGFIVFIGGQHPSEKRGLFALDTKLDKIRLLGKAPDPAPLSKETLDELKSQYEPNSGVDPCREWGWGPFCRSNLEPDICKFIAPHILQVSYGRDTCRYRSKHRIIRKWTL
jgi:hypothetical protein